MNQFLQEHIEWERQNCISRAEGRRQREQPLSDFVPGPASVIVENAHVIEWSWVGDDVERRAFAAVAAGRPDEIIDIDPNMEISPVWT